MSDIAPAPRPPRYSNKRVRYRVERRDDCYAVVERLSGDLVQGGFTSDRAAWTWLINCIDGRHA
jgi:hypothetical protein